MRVGNEASGSLSRKFGEYARLPDTGLTPMDTILDHDKPTYKKFDLSSFGDEPGFMNFVLMALKSAEANNEAVSPFAMVSGMIDRLNADAQKEGKNRKSGEFLRTMLLLEQIKNIYHQIDENNAKIAHLIEKVGEIDNILRNSAGKSFEEMHKDTRKTLESLGYDADKILENAKDKGDLTKILEQVQEDTKQAIKTLEDHNKQLTKNAENLTNDVVAIQNNPDLTDQEKTEQVKAKVAKSRADVVLEAETTTMDKKASQALSESRVAIIEDQHARAAVAETSPDFFENDFSAEVQQTVPKGP